MSIFGWFRRRNADGAQVEGAGEAAGGAGDTVPERGADEAVGIPRQTAAAEAADSQDQEATK
ncbi:hypothetical protein [Streptomyces avicenniae]|uniref:hypothetical protein n=1 Tax=Streptomyces avicenniae TaxID=500153 RepID=UPI00069BA802|nr:hypothetical protein [Streptomyces avicenniae]